MFGRNTKMSDSENASNQLFVADSDLFDAEIESDNEEAIVNNENDAAEENETVAENDANHEDKSDEEDSFHDSNSEDEESLEKIKQKARKFKTTLDVTTSSTRELKKRKVKKDDRTKLHSETQRLVRESRVKLPYHQPESKDIRHFLKKVTVENDINNKLSRNNEPNQDEDVEKPTDISDTEAENLERESDNLETEPQSLETDNQLTIETKSETAIKPKLSGASDPFFFEDDTSKKPPGLNNLMERFLKHNKNKLKQAEVEEISKVEQSHTETSDVVEVTNEVEKLQTADTTDNVKNVKISQPFFKPGDNLRSVKERLQENMKLQRAEVRKIHETQRKIDNEEVSDEEEEEDFEDDEDSDFEIEEWNADDVRAQAERSLEENETNDTECDEESKSIADSDTNHGGLKTYLKTKHSISTFSDEQTIDLFPSDNSNQTANRTIDEDASDDDSVGSQQSIKLRLDSVEDTQDGLTDDSSGFTKLKTPDNVHEQSSDTSNLPNGQGQESEMNKTSEILDKSNSDDALTPFSRLLGVDCSSGAREKSKPISELTLPVEDSQDLYDDDDVDKRFSDGLNTSKDFNFALDEDTQFTQFVDTQGYLLSTAKKKRSREDQKSSNMSELLGLCSGTFSDEPKKSESQQDMSELLGLCSGKFSGASNAKTTTESQDNMNELLGLCSGRFTDEKTNSKSESKLFGLCSGTFGKESTQLKSTSKTENRNELLGLCSGKFNNETKFESESQDMNELLGLCSGKFGDTQRNDSTIKSQNSSDLFDLNTNISLQSESTKKDQMIMNEMLRESSGQFNSVGSTVNSGNEKSAESESGIFSELGENAKRKPKSKQGLLAIFENMKDDENSMDDVVALCSGKFPSSQKSKETTTENGEAVENQDSDIEVHENTKNEKHSDVEDNSENSDNDVFSDDERQADSDDETEEDKIKKSKKYGITYGKKVHSIFNKDNFVEEEAELSGSDASSDEEEGSEDDELEEDSDVEDLPSDEELQRQVNKVHLKSVIDEDKRELRELKERYLEDGDLYSEGGGRARNFKWHGLEDSQLDMFDNKVLWGEDEVVDSALLTDAEFERRKMKHERDQFLQEQLAREADSQPTDVDENSQNILNLIRDTSNSAADEKIEIPKKPVTKRQDSTSTKLSQKRGSFLNRNKDQMSRLSSITLMKQTVSSARGFVFHAISPSSKAKENAGQKLQRSASLSEPPNPKRPRLDRTLSNNNNATGSLFTAMAV